MRQRAKPSGKQNCVTIYGILDHQPLHTTVSNTFSVGPAHKLIAEVRGIPATLFSVSHYLSSFSLHKQKVQTHVYKAHTSLLH